jgi:nickel-type superoxide dismutase maturation protease
VRALPISRFIVSGNSMLPLLSEGKSVVSFNWYYLLSKPKIGDIVVAQVGKRLVVKKISAIRAKEVFLIGEYRDKSTDSRNFGWVKHTQLIGKVILSF